MGLLSDVSRLGSSDFPQVTTSLGFSCHMTPWSRLALKYYTLLTSSLLGHSILAKMIHPGMEIFVISQHNAVQL